MATSSISGGSQIDVNTLVSQLVAAERKPLDDQVARATSKVTTQISATSALLGALSSFQSALNGLKTTTVFSGRSTTSTNEDIVTATATANAVPGSYDIEVEQLATAQQISSTAFAGGSTTVVGSGTLTISLGGTSFSVGVADPGNTLDDIRNAINSSTANPGVSASIITAADGAHLVLTSTKTGASNAIQVTSTGTLTSLEYSSTNQANYTQLRAAQDARVIVAGNYTATSETNTITGVIDGVSLNLASAQDGTTVSVAVGYDKDAAKEKINSFVTAYNSLRSMITRLSSYDSATGSAGVMLGDSLLTGIDSEIRRTLSTPVEAAGATVQTLSAIGITTQKDGTLAVDATKLDTALANDFDGVARLFGTAETGVAAKLYNQVSDRLADGGAIDTRNKNLTAEQKRLEKKSDDIDARMAIVQKTYLAQFTRLDTLLSTLSTTSSYLSQQLESLPSWSSD